MKSADKAVAREIILGLLHVAKASTMKSIYERITPDEYGVIRTSMSPTAETGRFTHSETFLHPSTNLANLPNRTAALDPLYEVRSVIVPHSGRLLWKSDYEQAEARWCAYMADDPKRIEMFEKGIDQYRYFVAVLKWDNPERAEEIPKSERNAIGKVGILAGQYKVGWKTLQDRVNKDSDVHGIAIDAKTAKKMEALWPELFPRTVQWWDEVAHEVLTKGFMVNPFGRRRDFLARRDSAAAEAGMIREAIANGPQSANADMLSTAIKTLYRKHDPKDLRLLLQVHDEIVGDCSPEDWSRVARIVRECMEFPVTLKGRTFTIPAEVSVTATSWAKTRKVA